MQAFGRGYYAETVRRLRAVREIAQVLPARWSCKQRLASKHIMPNLTKLGSRCGKSGRLGGKYRALQSMLSRLSVIGAVDRLNKASSTLGLTAKNE